MMMEALRTSETSVDNHSTRQYNPEDSSEHHTRRRENFKSQTIANFGDGSVFVNPCSRITSQIKHCFCSQTSIVAHLPDIDTLRHNYKFRSGISSLTLCFFNCDCFRLHSWKRNDASQLYTLTWLSHFELVLCAVCRSNPSLVLQG
jgi:hypothetical protein